MKIITSTLVLAWTVGMLTVGVVLGNEKCCYSRVGFNDKLCSWDGKGNTCGMSQKEPPKGTKYRSESGCQKWVFLPGKCTGGTNLHYTDDGC
jgi:hypothetical protein